MRKWALGIAAVAALSAQAPDEIYRVHCAGCHGPTGEGSRGPRLSVSALQRANDIDSLMVLLRRGIPGTEMAAIPSQTVPDKPLRALAEYVLAFRTTEGNKSSGRVSRGAELFRTKGKCLDCHRVNGEGRATAPDLTDVARVRDLQWLRRAVVEPQADVWETFGGYRWTISIPDNYLYIDLTTKNGERISGSRLNEDPFSIQLRDGEGRIRSFLKKEVAEIRKHWGKSPMPSYREAFSADELDDLVAYLASLRGLR
jgi:putative heme-binding domain-containing protein